MTTERDGYVGIGTVIYWAVLTVLVRKAWRNTETLPITLAVKATHAKFQILHNFL